jgi:hypothetical protein
MGLVNKLPDPVMVNSWSDNAAIGVNILMLNPLSPQSSVSATGFSPSLFTNIFESLLVITAPSFCMISIAALSSLLLPGLSMTVSPRNNNAAAHARCMELFDAGASIFPDNLDVVISTFMILNKI